MATLHPVKKVDAIVPRYVTRFQCVGPSCPDSCCSGWAVTIDRKTHIAYQKVQSETLKERMQAKLSRTRKGDQESSYSSVEMNADSGDCPFLEDKLCSVQRELGEDKLSNTCFSYPRFTTEMAGIRQQSMTLSCPEAARLALCEPDGLDFTQSTMLVRPEQISLEPARWGLSAELTRGIRFFALQILQTQTHELWERIAILGLLCETVDSLVRKGQQGMVATAITHLRTTIDQQTAKEALSPLQPDHAAQVIVFTRLWGKRGVTASSNLHRQVAVEVSEGLGLSGEESTFNQEELVNRYSTGLNLLEKTLAPVPFLIQNYVLNDMFREVFPFGASDSTEHFRRLVVRYGIIRLMLAARCRAKERPLEVPEIVETIQVFARLHQHNAQFGKRADESLKAANWDSLEKIFRFLRT